MRGNGVGGGSYTAASFTITITISIEISMIGNLQVLICVQPGRRACGWVGCILQLSETAGIRGSPVSCMQCNLYIYTCTPPFYEML